VLTVAEAGVPGFAINGWYGVIGPAHLPTDVVAKLHKAIETGLRDSELITQLEQQGEEAAGGTPEQSASCCATTTTSTAPSSQAQVCSRSDSWRGNGGRQTPFAGVP